MKRRLAAVTVGLLAAAPLRPLACAACFGRSDSAMAVGMNWGILSLLVVIATMLGLIASFFVFIARRAAAAPVEGASETAVSSDRSET